MNALQYWYFELLRRGVPKWVIALFILASISGVIVGFIWVCIVTNGLVAAVSVVVLTVVAFGTIITGVLPDDPRKKKGDE